MPISAENVDESGANRFLLVPVVTSNHIEVILARPTAPSPRISEFITAYFDTYLKLNTGRLPYPTNRSKYAQSLRASPDGHDHGLSLVIIRRSSCADFKENDTLFRPLVY